MSERTGSGVGVESGSVVPPDGSSESAQGAACDCGGLRQGEAQTARTERAVGSLAKKGEDG